MSLGRLGMRLATCRALRDATLAEGRVFDSAVDPLDLTVATDRQPILIVTTDDHETEEVKGRDLMGPQTACDLVIEAAIGSRVEVTGPDGEGGETTIEIPHTDEGMELMLDLMEHQVVAALTQEQTDWSRVWLKLVPRVSRRLSRRGATVEKGVRFAARQLVLTCDLIEAPAPGAAIAEGSSWHDLLTVMEADDALASFAGVLRAEIEGKPLTDWRRAAIMLGIHRSTANALGIGPILDLDDDPETLEEAIVSGSDTEVTVDQDMLDAQGMGEDGEDA